MAKYYNLSKFDSQRNRERFMYPEMTQRWHSSNLTDNIAYSLFDLSL